MSGLWISELFGPTIQGEGPHAGRACMFLRLAGCNLACTWCDTPYTWDWRRFRVAEQTRRIELAEIVADLEQAPAALTDLVITGGEPLMQSAHLHALTGMLRNSARPWRVHIETAGTLMPHALEADHWVVSPKLASSGNPVHKALVPDVLLRLRELGADFKFVLTSPADLPEVVTLVRSLRIPPSRVWCMPEGTDGETMLTRARALVGPVLAEGFNLTLRGHILLWGTERCR